MDNQAQDKAAGQEGVGVSPIRTIVEKSIEKATWFIDRIVFPENVRAEAEAALKGGMALSEALDLFGGKNLGRQQVDGNLLLNEGINEIWTLVAGGSATAFNNANSYLAVGNSATAAAATQTGLQGASQLYKAMDASYPTYGTSQKITFRSTYGSSDANFAWEEFTVANGGTDADVNMNRKVSSQGTKTSGQTWQLTLEITLS